jgi:CubicO group peptidase (beta-lactamase class C family)
MKKTLLLLLLIMSFRLSKAQNLYFPPIAGTNWDTVSASSLGWCQDKLDSLLDYLGSRNTKAFILLKDGKIVAEKYYGTFTVDSLWYWASAGKTLTGFTIGIAQQEGYLSLNDSSSHYLGAGWTVCPPAKEGMITVRHQLSMTTGLDDGVPDNHCTDDTCLQYLADAGTRWAYHNGPYTKLDAVIQNATGLSLNTYVTQKIKNPTGIQGLFVPVGDDNVFYSKARSMARFGLLLLNRGNWNGTQILTDTVYFNQMTNSSQNINPSYGYLTWLNGKSSYMVPGFQISIPGFLNAHAPADMYAAIGKNGQFINVVPGMGLVYVRMGNAPGQGDVPFLLNDTIWQKLNGVMCGATGVKKVDLQKNLVEVFPNPGSGVFTVYPMQNVQGLISLKIYDSMGRIIKFFTINDMKEQQFSLDGFADGMYSVVAEYENLVQTRTFILSR